MTRLPYSAPVVTELGGVRDMTQAIVLGVCVEIDPITLEVDDACSVAS